MLKEGIILGERYEIISRIGSGGMADVYKAHDHKLNRMVAVKVMKPEFREDTSFVAKFQKEAQAAAKLSHPNVVNVFDVGEDRGMYYIVMELVEGITLKNYITKKGKLSVKETTSIAIQVSLGLEAAHNQGIVHRDVKPQNIIISTDGKVKLSDFGIAKAINSNTITANVMGSVHYSSPEQVRGGVSDAKSDIYSLGVTMYEMVTGRVPFDGDSTVSIAIKHLQEEMVPPSRYTPDLPYSLEQIILKCTQKDPDRRYHQVGELIEDLKHSLVDPQGNFVSMVPLTAHAQTVRMSDHEMDEIRRGFQDPQDDRYDDDYQDDRKKPRDYDRDYDRDEDDDEDDSPVSSKLEKTVTIAGFLIGAVIIIILILVIGNMAGLIHFGKSNSSSGSSSVTASSSTADQVSVPNLLGMTLDEATTAANKLGIGVKQTGTAASKDYPEGQIISQTIPEGTKVDKSTTVEVVVSSGAGDVTVPTGLTGASQADAQNALESVGLTANISLQSSDTVEVGYVISVDPAEGTSVADGTAVTLNVSKGAGTENVTIPNLTGTDEATAKSTLDSLGLSYTTVKGKETSLADGDVISTDPAAGESVSAGTTVTLTVNSLNDSTTDGKYVCYSPLSQPSGYSGGQVRMELVQGTTTTVIYEGSNPWTNGAYSDPIYSDSNETGTINVYEDDVLIAKYPNVTFEAVSG